MTTPTTLNGEVRGTAIRSITDAIDEACGFFDGRTRDHLAAHDLADASGQAWYDVGECVAVYDDLLETTGRHTVRRIGKELANRFAFDRDVDSFEEALTALDDAYRHLHRGDVGGYRFESTGAESGRLVCRTPYPEALEQGLLRGLAQRFTDTGYVTTDLVTTDQRDGLRVTTLDVEWWGGTAIEPAEPDEAIATAGPAGAD
jgi:hypothetical protein